MAESDDPIGAIKEHIRRLDEQAERIAKERSMWLEALRVAAPELADALTEPPFSGKREGMTTMIPQVRVRHSQGKSKTLKAERPNSKHVTIANAAGFSLHSLGEHPSVNCTASMLSQAASGGVGMSAERAKAIQKLTRSKEYPRGIEATMEFWPLLRDPKA